MSEANHLQFPISNFQFLSNQPMQIEILTIFPQLFESTFRGGMIRQATKKGLLRIKVTDLRDFATDRHRTVDDRPYGGGEGMVMKPEPIFRSVETSKKRAGKRVHVVILSPQGETLNQSVANGLTRHQYVLLICGRYEGVDQRVADHLADQEISIGDYVLSGGEFAAMVVTDAVCRLIPGVLGNADSVLEDSFMYGQLDYPQYTRPADFRGWRVPPVLSCGDHEEIRRWREEQAYHRTRTRRPDLLASSRQPGEED